MAQNQLFDAGVKLSVIPTNGAQTTGAPGRYGGMTGVALNNVLTDTTVSMNFGSAVWSLLVDAHVNGGGGSAIAVGDSIFYTDATANATHLSKDAAGYFFGYAMAANAGVGTATTIAVLHPSCTGGILGAGAIGATQLASDSVTTVKLLANNVTAAKVTSTMRTGYIPLPLPNWLIAATTLGAIAANTGMMASDSTPTLTRVNAATDPTMVVTWVANGVLAITHGAIMSPPDLDNTQPVVFNMWAAMGGNTDHPTSTLGMFEGPGGTTIGGTMPAMAGGATPAVYSLNCTSVATLATPKAWSFIFTPAAHGTDTLLLYAAWLTYTRK